MPLKRLTFAALFVLCCLCAAPGEARADTVFILSGSTQLSFTCHQSAQCSGSPGSVTFGTGDNTTTFTFTGVTINNASVGNVSSPMTLFTVQTTITGEGYVDTSGSSFFGLSSPLGFLNVTFTETSPTAVTRTISPFLSGGSGGYRLTFGLAGGFGGTYFTTPTGNSGYPLIAFSFPNTIQLPAGSTVNGNAQVGAVPEPATMVLLGTGLVGVVGAARRRRRAQKGE